MVQLLKEELLLFFFGFVESSSTPVEPRVRSIFGRSCSSCIFKVLALQVASKGRGANDALKNCVDVASVADVVEP